MGSTTPQEIATKATRKISIKGSALCTHERVRRFKNISKYLGHSDLATTRCYLEAAGLSFDQRAKVDNVFAALSAA